MPYDLVLQAAEYSIAAENKLAFMNKILYNWHSNNIRTINEARTDHERHLKGLYVVGRSNPLKQVDFGNSEQHSYTDEELESLFGTLKTDKAGFQHMRDLILKEILQNMICVQKKEALWQRKTRSWILYLVLRIYAVQLLS